MESLTTQAKRIVAECNDMQYDQHDVMLRLQIKVLRMLVLVIEAIEKVSE